MAIDDGSGNMASRYIDESGIAHESTSPSCVVPKILADLSGGISDRAWQTSEGNCFTVAPASPEQVNTCTKDYQLSEANRVLVHDAIAQSGIGNTPVYLGVTLPTSQFYTGDDTNPINKARIQAKRENILQTVTNYTGNYPSPNVVGALVYPEAIPAYVYCVQSSENPDEYPEDHLTLVVDLGRFTCDIALIGTGYQVIDFATTEHGVYKLVDKFKQLMTRHSAELNLSDLSGFSDHLIDQIIELGYIGSTLETPSAIAARKDVSALVQEAKEFLAGLIIADMKNIAPDFSTLTRIVFVGGGANWLSEIAQDWYHTVTIPEQPEMAIVRGTHLMLEGEREKITASMAANNKDKAEVK